MPSIYDIVRENRRSIKSDPVEEEILYADTNRQTVTKLAFFMDTSPKENYIQRKKSPAASFSGKQYRMDKRRN